MNMVKKWSVSAASSMAALFLSLYLWRIAYPTSDYAALALFPLTAMLFYGNYLVSAAVHRARLLCAIRSDSPIARIFTGKIFAIFSTISFVAISIPILAWLALTSGVPELMILAFLCFVANGSFMALQSRSSHHLRQPFADAAVISFGTWIIAVVFIPLIAWVNWNYASHLGEIRLATLTEAVLLGIQELPPRRGWIAEVLSPLYAYEAAKLWIVVQLGTSKWATILFSFDTALVSFLLARISMILTLLGQKISKEGAPT